MEQSIVEIVKGASALMMEAGGAPAFAEKGSARNIVTRYDVDIQRCLVEELSALAPGSVFVGEESGLGNPDLSGRFFIVDPIDGTSNFARGAKRSCISVAYGEAGSVKCGVVYDPYLDEVFSATLGSGARVNGKPIRNCDVALEKSIVCFGTCPYDLERADTVFESAKAVFRRCLDLRRTGSAALEICYTAMNRYDVFFEHILYPWDYAAATLVVSEAGGCVLDFKGVAPALDRRDSVVCGAPRAVGETRAILLEVMHG